ncbi:hypothetical protein KL936_004862 [Ogataea polymorpha]|nr:hypothetical protein KL936_004862 [Ogataea polymorpha]
MPSVRVLDMWEAVNIKTSAVDNFRAGCCTSQKYYTWSTMFILQALGIARHGWISTMDTASNQQDTIKRQSVQLLE